MDTIEINETSDVINLMIADTIDEIITTIEKQAEID